MRSLADLLVTAAERDPDGPAVTEVGSALTWAQASAGADRLGAALDEAGVGPGDRVGVHHRKSTEGFLAMHAVVGRGAIAVPLDPSASVPYLTSVVEGAGVETVLTNEGCAPTARALAATGRLASVIGIDHDPAGHPGGDRAHYLGPDAVSALDPGRPRDTVDPEAGAYLITTSGSTGRPKGILHSHTSALAYVRFKLAAYDYEPTDRIVDLAPNHFDISTQALWVTPFVGATNVVIPEPYQMLPASLSQLMADEAVSVWYGVPFVLAQLVARGSLEDRDLSALRWVLFGGEVMTPGVLARLMALVPGARFSNVYGPAEVNACAVHHLDRAPTDDETIPIGLPVAGTEIALIDPDDPGTEIVEPGAQGEIVVRSETMMVGYWGQPDLDERAFLDRRGQRWYRTGDLAHRLPAGPLVFTGRVDHQVKIRGYRVELEAIETVLEDLAGVEHAVAAVARSADGTDVVIAGIEAPAGAEGFDAGQVLAGAVDRMPSYAVPRNLYRLQSLPVTGSGKLDRRFIRSELLKRHAGTERGGEGARDHV